MDKEILQNILSFALHNYSLIIIHFNWTVLAIYNAHDHQFYNLNLELETSLQKLTIYSCRGHPCS